MSENYGIHVTPEMIKELLDEGYVSVEQDDGTQIGLMYETVPRNMSEGWNE